MHNDKTPRRGLPRLTATLHRLRSLTSSVAASLIPGPRVATPIGSRTAAARKRTSTMRTSVIRTRTSVTTTRTSVVTTDRFAVRQAVRRQAEPVFDDRRAVHPDDWARPLRPRHRDVV